VTTWTTLQGVTKGLDEKMRDVKRQISKITMDVAMVAAAAATTAVSGGTATSRTIPLQQEFGCLGFGVNLTAGGGNPTNSQLGIPPTTQGTNAALKLRLKLLEEEVWSLKFGTKSASIVGQEFASKAAVAAWMKTNCPNDRGYLLCVDIHSFLALAFTMYKDMQSQVQMEVMSK